MKKFWILQIRFYRHKAFDMQDLQNRKEMEINIGNSEF